VLAARARLREVLAMPNVVGLIIALCLAGYLLYAVFRPEKF
jgi:K+-transporting ATPase KdpF subunit